MERTKRMTTGLERVFRPVPGHQHLFREVLLHWIYFLDEYGESTGMKLDKQIEGGLFKVAQGTERSLYGEFEYTFPDGVTRRLVGVRENVAFS